GLRRLIGAIEDQVCSVEVEALRGEFGEAQSLGGDGGEDGVALAEEGIEGTAEAVVVEAVAGGVPEEGGGGGGGPGGGGGGGGRVAEACGEQQAEDAAVGELPLGIWRQVGIDDVGNVEALEERGDEGQRAEGAGRVGDGGILPSEGHRASRERVGWR